MLLSGFGFGHIRRYAPFRPHPQRLALHPFSKSGQSCNQDCETVDFCNSLLLCLFGRIFLSDRICVSHGIPIEEGSLGRFFLILWSGKGGAEKVEWKRWSGKVEWKATIWSYYSSHWSLIIGYCTRSSIESIKRRISSFSL